MSKLSYEELRRKRIYVKLPISGGTKTLLGLKKRGIITYLECAANGLSLEELEVQSETTGKQPFYIMPIESRGLKLPLGSLLQANTETDLSKNCFTQAQVCELIETQERVMSYANADSILMIFRIKKDDKDKDLIALINHSPISIHCFIYDLEDPKLWSDGGTKKAVVIKTN